MEHTSISLPIFPWFTLPERSIPLPVTLRAPADYQTRHATYAHPRGQGPVAWKQAHTDTGPRRHTAAHNDEKDETRYTTSASASRRAEQADNIEIVPILSTMNVLPYIQVGNQILRDDSSKIIVPFQPSDLGDTYLDNSDEVLVVNLTQEDGGLGWAYFPSSQTMVIQRQGNGELRFADLSNVQEQVKQRVDILAGKSRRLDKALYKPCNPIKNSKLIVTLVLTEHLTWHSHDAL